MTIESATVGTVSVAAATGVVALVFTPSDINNTILAATGLVTAIGIIVSLVLAYMTKRMTAVEAKIDINTRLTEATVKVTEEVKATTASTAQVAAKIDGHVNSEKTASEGRETALKMENALLREMLTEKKQVAAVLAAAVQATGAAASTPAMPTTEPVVKSLESIDSQASEIATNTKRTEAVVQELKEGK